MKSIIFKQTCLLVFSLFYIIVLPAQIKVYPANQVDASIIGEGAFYCLPQTLLKVDVTHIATTITPADSFSYEWLQANKNYLNNVINYEVIEPFKIKKEAFTINNLKSKDIVISSSAIIDTSKVYFAQLKKRGNRETNLTLTYGTNYLLNSVESSVTNQTFEIVTKLITTGVGIVGSLIKNSIGNGGTFSAESLPPQTNREVKFSLNAYLDLQLKKYKKLDSLENDYATGKITVNNPEILNKYLATIKEQKENIISIISYTASEKIMNTVFEVLPQKNKTKYPLFEYDMNNGVDTLNNAIEKGKRYYFIKNNLELATNNKAIYYLDIELEPNIASITNSNATPANSEDYFKYNIPAQANIVIKTNSGKQVITNSTAILPQLGNLGYIKSSVAKNTFDVDGTTGALKKVVLVKKPKLTSAKVDAAAGVVEKIKTATDNNQKEIDALKKEKERLELLEAVKKLKAANKESDN